MLADPITAKERPDTYLKDYLEASANIAKTGGAPKTPSTTQNSPASTEIKVSPQTITIRVQQPQIKIEQKGNESS